MAIMRFSTGFRDEIGKAGGKSYADTLANGVIRFFAGTMPSTADLTEGATHLVQITIASGAFTPGETTNGINFDVATAGVVAKKSGDVWSGVGTSEAGASPGKTITWGCFYDNALTTGATSVGKRVFFDVTRIGFGGACELENTTAILSQTLTLNNGSLTIPATA